MPTDPREVGFALPPLDALALAINGLHMTAEQRVDVDIAFQAVVAEHEELRFKAYHDELTGLPNRAYAILKFEELVASGEEFAMMKSDAENFKLINDKFGHHTGDLALKFLANTLIYRKDDMFSVRISGDEFMMLYSLKPHEPLNIETNHPNSTVRDFTNKARMETVNTRSQGSISAHPVVEQYYELIRPHLPPDVVMKFGIRVNSAQYQEGMSFEDLAAAADTPENTNKRDFSAIDFPPDVVAEVQSLFANAVPHQEAELRTIEQRSLGLSKVMLDGYDYKFIPVVNQPTRPQR